jgi:hypothetical protein
MARLYVAGDPSNGFTVHLGDKRPEVGRERLLEFVLQPVGETPLLWNPERVAVQLGVVPADLKPDPGEISAVSGLPAAKHVAVVHVARTAAASASYAAPTACRDVVIPSREIGG